MAEETRTAHEIADSFLARLADKVDLSADVQLHSLVRHGENLLVRLESGLADDRETGELEAMLHLISQGCALLGAVHNRPEASEAHHDPDPPEPVHHPDPDPDPAHD